MITRKYRVSGCYCITTCPIFANISIGSHWCSHCKYFISRDSDNVTCLDLSEERPAIASKGMEPVVDIDIPLTDDMLLMMYEIEGEVRALNEEMLWLERSTMLGSEPHIWVGGHGKLVFVNGDD